MAISHECQMLKPLRLYAFQGFDATRLKAASEVNGYVARHKWRVQNVNDRQPIKLQK